MSERAGLSVIGVGDSLTYGYGVPPGKGWFDCLQTYYPGVTFINCGVPGDSTAGMLRRFLRDASELAPDYVTILGGSNDILQGIALETIVHYISQLVAAAQTRHSEPVLILPLTISRRPGPWGWVEETAVPAARQQFVLLRQQLSQYAEEAHLQQVDPMAALTDEAAIENHFLEDGVHVNAALHKRIAAVFAQTIVF
jgi:lysophospholipase L1-like esterase